MHNPELILMLAAGFSAALALGYLTHRLGLSPIVGYLVAGTLVGPYTPGFIGDAEVAEQLAEVGVILLMFGVGLQFHIDELLAVRGVAIPGAILQSAVATALGATIARAFGWTWPAAIVFGMALSVASTVVLIRVLADYRDLHTRTGHIAVGWLVVEDVLTVLALVLLPVLFGDDAADVGIAQALIVTLLKVGALGVFTIVVGSRVIPRALDHVAATGSRELFTLTVLVLALGIAVAAARLFGVSMALGAFLSGLIVGRSDYSLRAASDALPMRDAFAVLFFVAVGMLLDPRVVVQAPALTAATLIVVLVGKPAAALLLMWLLRYPFRVSVAIAIALAQIGEFSFILSSLARDLGLFTAEATNTLVAVSIVSIVVNPLLYRAIPAMDDWVNRRPTLRRWLNPSVATDVVTAGAAAPQSLRQRAVIVGYGPTGRTVSRLLRENGIEPVVIEMNIDTVRRLRSEGQLAIYGDAAQPDTLIAAEIANAESLILTSAGMSNTAEAIRTAREINPKVPVFARAGYVRDIDELHHAGADEVFSGESEVALAFTEAILQRLGATAEQIDRERERAHAELFGPATRRSRDSVEAATPHQGS